MLLLNLIKFISSEKVHLESPIEVLSSKRFISLCYAFIHHYTLTETTKNDQIRTPNTWKDERSVEQQFNVYTRLVIDFEQIQTSVEMKQVD